MPGPTYRRSPFRFRSPDAILRSSRRPLEREEEMSRELDRLERTPRQSFTFQPPRITDVTRQRFRTFEGEPQFTQTDPEFLKYREKARRFGIDLGEIREPSTLLGGRGIQENVPQRHIFGQESQAFAEEVAPREHQRYLIPEDQPFGLPGRVAREVTAVDPGTIFAAPLVGPSVFGRGALEAAPTLKQVAGTALTAVGADLPVAAGQIGRAGLRALA